MFLVNHRNIPSLAKYATQIRLKRVASQNATAIRKSSVKCTLCDNVFQDEQGLKVHMGIKHRSLNECPTCGKSQGTSTKSNFNAHMKSCAAKYLNASSARPVQSVVKCVDKLKPNVQPRCRRVVKANMPPPQADAVPEHRSPV